ncbi:hypothetical protein G7Y89_g13092 [Cudoniella acicularis]|uniref:Major facilitator superfamily (MFS) profile domain-containing protein n=1 Tax=Cudoniella acicularis TaxID=354080 RepID=A0A8H4VWD9_9HELO|nr:hypothetical protein G7Y89_g13092 [Cudoniella acicularis]
MESEAVAEVSHSPSTIPESCSKSVRYSENQKNMDGVNLEESKNLSHNPSSATSYQQAENARSSRELQISQYQTAVGGDSFSSFESSPVKEQDVEKGQSSTEAIPASPLFNPQLALPSVFPLDSEDEPAPTYPEGGLGAWLVVFGAWCGMFASLGIGNTLATYQAYISQNILTSHSPMQIGWIFSLYTFLTFDCGIYIGPIFDVYGPRWLVLPGSMCMVAAMFLMPECTKYWHFIIVFGILGGIGTSLIFTPSIAAVGHFFNRRRGNATGLAASGSAFGGIIFPIVLKYLIPKIGFVWAGRVMGLIVLVLCIIANLFIKSRLPPTQRPPHPDFRIFKDRAFALTVLGVFFLEWALFIPLTYITSYALAEGFTRTMAYMILPILNAGSAVGRWLPGFFSDKLGRYNTTILFILVTIFSIIAIWLPFGSYTSGLVIFALLFGFASGSNISLTPVCIGQLCETKDYGRYYATCYTVVSFGCLTGVPIAGVLIRICGGSYWGLVLFTGISYVVALVAFAGARILKGGWAIFKKF